MIGVSFLLYFIASWLTRKNNSLEASSEYECGFAPFDDATRRPFSIHYFVVSILFLIFDIEIVLLIPWVLNMDEYGVYGFLLIFIFLAILIFGFVYEWHIGALKWPQFNSKVLSKSHHKLSAIFVLFFFDLGSLEVFDNHFFMYLFYNFYLEFFLVFLILCSLLQIIFFKIFKIKIRTGSLNNGLNVVGENDAKKFNNDFIGFDFADNQLFLNNAVSVLKRFYSIVLVALLVLNCFVITIDLVGPLNFMKTQLFYVNFFDNNFILDHSWCDRFYLCVTSLLLFLTLFIVRLTEYNFRWIREPGLFEFYFCILNALFFFIVSVKSVNFMGVLLGVIGFSVVTYFLILTDAKSPLAGEAAIKYYYLSVLSSVFIAIGIFIIFAKFGTLSFSELNFLFYYFVETQRYDFGITVFLPIFLIVTGFLFKLNCFPCHWWSGEVYYGLSYTLLAFFILPVKLCVYALILKICFTVFSSLAYFWQPYILFSACGSMIFGAFFAANELKIKKFLAYSSINQFGFVLINLVAINVNHAQSVLASFFFVIVYLIMNIVLLWILNSTFNYNQSVGLMIASNKVSRYWVPFKKSDCVVSSNSLRQPNRVFLDVWKIIEFDFVGARELKYLTDLKKYSWYNWGLVRHIVIIFLSMAGIPPFAGFFTKLYILKSALEYNQMFLVVCALVGSLISSYYYIRVIKILFFEPISISISTPGFTKHGCFISYVNRKQLFFLEILLTFLCFFLVIENAVNLVFGKPWSFLVISFIFNDFLSYLVSF